MAMAMARVAAAMVTAMAAVCCAAAQALPDPAALIKEVQAHQQAVEQIRENFTFHEAVRTEELNADGSVRGVTSEDREVFYVNGRRVFRVLKKNGMELSAPEARAEQARVKKLVESDMKAPPVQVRTGTRLISQILAVTKLSNTRVTALNGRPTLVFDFAGDPAAKAHGMEQSVAKKLTGTIWVDRADRQVARVEILVAEDYRLAGGLLANIRKGSQLTVEQAPVGDGLWLQTATEEHVAARVLLKSERQNVHIRDFDFQRFDVGMLQKINPVTP